MRCEKEREIFVGFYYGILMRGGRGSSKEFCVFGVVVVCRFLFVVVGVWCRFLK